MGCVREEGVGTVGGMDCVDADRVGGVEVGVGVCVCVGVGAVGGVSGDVACVEVERVK